MENLPITAGHVGFFIVVLSAIAAMWWRVEGAIGKAKSEAITRAEAAAALATYAQTQLADHRLHVAETYITKAGMRETKEEIIAVVHGVKQSVDQMNQRMDRVIEGTRSTPLKSHQHPG